VLIVEDQREIREGLARLIDRAVGFRCVGRYRSMEAALAGSPSDPPAVALLDIGLPGISGIAGIEPLKARYPDVLVLMITVHDDDERIFEAMCAGACGIC
jgi:DNA-binding NarL/FixJ family response regulator